MIKLRTLSDLRRLRYDIKHGKVKPHQTVEAFRIARKSGASNWYGRTDGRKRLGPVLTTKVGHTLKVDRQYVCTSPSVRCGAGVNVGTMRWCDREWLYNPLVIFVVRFKVRDIACIPTRTDGKFRLYQCKVVRKAVRTDKRSISRTRTGRFFRWEWK